MGTYLYMYIYSRKKNKINEHNWSISCCQTFIFWYVHSVVGHKWGALIRAVFMSQECTKPSMQIFASVTNYFSRGLTMTICISYKEELNGWTHPLSLSFWRLWFTWNTLTRAHTPSTEILLSLRLQKVRQQKRSCSSFTINVLYT